MDKNEGSSQGAVMDLTDLSVEELDALEEGDDAELAQQAKDEKWARLQAFYDAIEATAHVSQAD